MKDIEIIIENPEQGIANYEPLKAWALEQAAVYGNLLVNPDAIKDAKTDMAMLRKMAKTASDLRIRIEREHAAKIANVSSQLKEVSGIFTTAAANIDKQVKEYDELRKEERRQEIQKIFDEEIGDLGDLITLQKVFDQSWLNKTTSEKTIRADIQAVVLNARAALEKLRALQSPHENAIISAFLERLSMIDALETKLRMEQLDAAMEKRREEESARRAEEAAREAERKAAQKETVEVPPLAGETVIARAEYKLAEARYGLRHGIVGFDENLVRYWKAYLDGARAQKEEDEA